MFKAPVPKKWFFVIYHDKPFLSSKAFSPKSPPSSEAVVENLICNGIEAKPFPTSEQVLQESDQSK